MKYLMALLVLVTLSMSTAQAQDWRTEDNNSKRLRINPFNRDGHFFTTSNKDFSSIGKEIRNATRDLRRVSVTRRGRRVTNKRSIFARKWDIDRNYPRRGTDHFVNIYLGLNNFIEDKDLVDSDELYSLHPISSWYAGFNFDNITRIYGPLYLEWGAGVSTQDFSFENTRARLVKDDMGITFEEAADVTGRKSKINVSYINVHFVPTISFGRYSDFRVGFGVYGGYKIGSFTKYKFDDANGDKQKEKLNDNLLINPFKYGFRAQVGWDFFDLFFNYDVTELFEEDKNAPRLNPVTFGIIF